MKKLERQLSELRMVLINPRSYLVDYLNEIRSQIVAECHFYLNGKISVSDAQKAVDQNEEMNNVVDQFQKECLSNLQTVGDGSRDLEVIEDSLKATDFEDKDTVLKAEKQIYCALFARKKALFGNRGLVFFSKKNQNLFFHLQENAGEWRSVALFGSLLVIEDDLLLMNDKLNQFKDTKLISYDWCNELLRIHFLTTSFMFELKGDRELGAVHRIKLNLKKQEILSIRFRHLDLAILKDWFVDIPALRVLDLRSCQLKELEPTIFHSLINLEKLYLFYNFIERLDPKIFSSLKNIKNLQLNNNQICELDRNSFQGLTNLKELDLSSNSIKVLPEGLFRDLACLEILNLNYNSINFINEDGRQQSGNVFQGLVSLSDLDLGYNCISCIPEGMFQDLQNLKVLCLHENRISECPVLGDSVNVIIGDVENLDDTFFDGSFSYF